MVWPRLIWTAFVKVFDNGHVAVDSASFSARDGELLVLVGPSGCGKSTTLRMLAGLESVTGGGLYGSGGGLLITCRQRIGTSRWCFQNYALYPHMSVYDNVAFGLKLRKYPKKEIGRPRSASRRDPRHRRDP